MAVETFPILRLPSIARENFLKSLDPVRVFLLSQLSRKMKRAIKAEYKKTGQELSVTVDYFTCISVCFSGTTTGDFFVHDARRSILQKVRLEDRLADPEGGRFSPRIPTFRFYKCDILGHTKQFLAELMDVFSFPIAKFYIDISSYENYQSVIQWVNTYCPITQLIRIDGREIDFEDYCWILENLESPNNVEFDVPIHNYEHRECGVPTFRAGKIKILHGEFVRLCHLQSLNGMEYNIGKATINDEELNEFLRDLVAGANPNLKKLTLEEYGRTVIDDVLKDLGARNIGENQWSFGLENGNEVVLSYCVSDPESKSSIDIIINRN
ncbi:hypothetical protein CAEBREN_19603 [Caenorhabditis brenneri]|uniref:F-box domain-containing protein n=1 Tax=Caenorhabditis brenneri TaxID=135651 RepID=G0NXM1_CAEBE|nr:hypothetical protein CAEBREN_19603 [Caenorhabditis brenneri]